MNRLLVFLDSHNNEECKTQLDKLRFVFFTPKILGHEWCL